MVQIHQVFYYMQNEGIEKPHPSTTICKDEKLQNKVYIFETTTTLNRNDTKIMIKEPFQQWT
jgi:hypothetical protein